MEELVTFCLIVLNLLVVNANQRIAPGVPPQQYQQPPPPQQYQQIPQQVHYQQSQHQVPVQQAYHQQVPVQPPQVHGGHPHDGHAQPQQLLNTANIALEKKQGHKDPHGQVPTGAGKLFTDEELTSLIDPILSTDDSNRDGYIDYPEFVQAQQKLLPGLGLKNAVPVENEEDKQAVKVQTDSDLEAMIDPILKEMDSNNDGYVDYAEFKKAS